MSLDLYHFKPSALCRSVRMVARALGLDLTLKHVDMSIGEQLSKDFIKLNPQHIVPTLDDNGFVLWESRAIMGYLVDKYAKDDSLFPKDPVKRAVVNQRLYFDATALYQSVEAYFYPVLFHGAKVNPELWKKVEEAFGFLDKFLEGVEWVAGDHITIADYAIAATTANAVAFGLDVDTYSNVTRWYSNAKNTIEDFEQLNQDGANTLGELLELRRVQKIGSC